VRFLPDIAEAFAKLVDESKGTQPVTVFSAEPLPQSEQDRMKAHLRETLKRDVEVTFHTDASHLAGLQIRIGSTVVDSTVRGRLRAMQSLLTKE
jgi:F-type H+-transporting ATPase subunit delta